jgi:hypothetical protein
MKHLRIGALVGALVVVAVSGTTATGQIAGTGAGPLDPHGLSEPAPVTRRASTARQAAALAQKAASWVNELGVQEVVERSLTEQDSRIRDVLEKTGQPGVLYRVDIQKTESEIPFYSVVGRQVQYVGAGTSPIGVNSAANQQAYLRPSPDKGATVDLGRSYFIWFTKDGKAIQATAIPAGGLINETARRFADRKLLESLNLTDQAHATKAALDHIERTTHSDEVKRKIAEMRARQEETNKRVLEIDAKLKAELERAQKAQAAATTLSLISSTLTLGTQIATLKASLGADAPPEIDSAKSPAELQQIANDLAKSAKDRGNAYQVDYNNYIDQARGVRLEVLQFVEKSNYPTTSVPELRHP